MKTDYKPGDRVLIMGIGSVDPVIRANHGKLATILENEGEGYAPLLYVVGKPEAAEFDEVEPYND